MIIALGESIVAIGVGADRRHRRGRRRRGGARRRGRRRLLVALLRRRRDRRGAPADREPREGRERNAIARDSYSYLHLPMVAGIALVAVGLKKTLAHVDEPLALVAAAALLGGAAMYLLAHVAFRWRNLHTLNRQRLVCAALLVALLVVEVLVEPPSLATVGVLAAVLSAADRLRGASFRRGARARSPPAGARAHFNPFERSAFAPMRASGRLVLEDLLRRDSPPSESRQGLRPGACNPPPAPPAPSSPHSRGRARPGMNGRAPPAGRSVTRTTSSTRWPYQDPLTTCELVAAELHLLDLFDETRRHRDRAPGALPGGCSPRRAPSAPSIHRARDRARRGRPGPFRGPGSR